MKSFSVLVAFLLCSTVVVTAQDYNLIGTGARAEALGGAFIGVADDATAIFWNPAGLTQLERPEASIVWRHRAVKDDYTNIPVFLPHQVVDNNYHWSESRGGLNFGSLVLPFTFGSMPMVAAAGYQRQLDLFSDWKYGNYDMLNSGSVETITPALGVQILPSVSLGAAANIWIGTHALNERFEYSGYIINDWPLHMKYNAVNDLQNTPDWTSYTRKQDLKYSGLNMVFSTMIDFETLVRSLPLKLGLTIRTPFSLTLNGVQQNIYGRYDIYNATTDRTMVEMPLMIGAGVSCRLTEQLMVAADYEYRGYGKSHYTDVPDFVNGGNGESTRLSVSQSLKDLNQLRLGAEYRVALKSLTIPFRIGYRSVPTLLEELHDINSHKQVTGSAYSLGAGCRTNLFAIDFSYTFTNYTQSIFAGSIGQTENLLGASLSVYY